MWLEPVPEKMRDKVGGGLAAGDPDFQLIALPSIKTPAELKGKSSSPL